MKSNFRATVGEDGKRRLVVETAAEGGDDVVLDNAPLRLKHPLRRIDKGERGEHLRRRRPRLAPDAHQPSASTTCRCALPATTTAAPPSLAILAVARHRRRHPGEVLHDRLASAGAHHLVANHVGIPLARRRRLQRLPRIPSHGVESNLVLAPSLTPQHNSATIHCHTACHSHPSPRSQGEPGETETRRPGGWEPAAESRRQAGGRRHRRDRPQSRP